MNKNLTKIDYLDVRDNVSTMVGDDNYYDNLKEYTSNCGIAACPVDHYPLRPIVCNELDDTVYIIESRNMNFQRGDNRQSLHFSELNKDDWFVLSSIDCQFRFEDFAGKFYLDNAFVTLNDAKNALTEIYKRYDIDILENCQFRIIEYVINKVYSFRTAGYQSAYFYSDKQWTEKFI